MDYEAFGFKVHVFTSMLMACRQIYEQGVKFMASWKGFSICRGGALPQVKYRYDSISYRKPSVCQLRETAMDWYRFLD